MNALLMPAFLVVAFLVKNETVKGIIGNTHGVSNATRPPINPRINNLSKPVEPVEEFTVADVPQFVCGLFISIEGIKILFAAIETADASNVMLNFCSSGIKFS